MKKVTANGLRLTNARSQKADTQSFSPITEQGLFRGWICVSVSQFQPKEWDHREREPEWGERLCRNHISAPTEVLRTSSKHFLTSSDKHLRSNGLFLIFFITDYSELSVSVGQTIKVRLFITSYFEVLR